MDDLNPDNGPAFRNAVGVDRRRALVGMLGAGAAVVAGCRSSDSTSREAVPPNSSDIASTTLSEASDPNSPLGTTASLPISRGDRDSDLHLLRRLTFGPNRTDVEHVRSIGAAAWLDEQFDVPSLDTASVDEALVEAFPLLDWTVTEILEDLRENGNTGRVGGGLIAAALVRHTQSPAQLFERLVEFWGDHFNVPVSTPALAAGKIEMDRAVIRPHAMGNFADLLVATAQSPAMLVYLDNFKSTVGAINENYARELLELHTLGVSGGYDEDDIVQVARLLTGWGVGRGTYEFRFAPGNHDDGTVSVLGWQRPSDGDPLDHGVELLRYLALLPATARHVSRKLAVRFVADEPSDDLIEAMSQAWLEHDSEIAPVIRAMVGHQSFQDAPPKFNRPWDYLMQTIRTVDGTLDPSFEPDVRDAVGAIRDLGQMPFRWPSPDGYPDQESAWLNGGALLARWNVTTQLVDPNNRVISTSLSDTVETLRGKTAAEIYDVLAAALQHEPLRDEQRTLLVDLTGWTADEIPDDETLTEIAPVLAVMLLAGPSTNYR